MKFKYIKSIVSAALFLSLTTGMTSCINDLDISPIDPQMTATFDQDMYFTKLYASLGLTGQKLSEDPDIAVRTKVNPVSIALFSLTMNMALMR